MTVRDVTEIGQLIEDHLDQEFIESTLVELVQSPSDVPNGEIAIEPDDAKIGRYVKEVVQPIVETLQVDEMRVDPLNNLIAHIGTGEHSPLLFMVAYSVSQHANLMEEPYSGRISSGKDFGWDEPCIFGKGASQNKGALAALLGAIKVLRDAGVKPVGSLILAVNSEGQSSHRNMEHIFRENNIRADGGVLCIGTGNRIALGNRGRVDVYVTVRGKTAHSSQPWLGVNAIYGMGEVISKLAEVQLAAEHPLLGKAQLTIYNLVCTPSSPHTIPDTCRAILDRRFLPGEELEVIVEKVKQVIGDLDIGDIEVEKGAWMYPALVDPRDPVVEILKRGHEEMAGQPVETFYPQYTFDAGYPCAAGVPTVMYGPASWADVSLGEEIVQTEFVALSQVITAAKVYANLFLQHLS